MGNHDIKEEARKRKSKKTRRTIKTIIIICLAVILVAVGIGIWRIMFADKATTEIEPDTTAPVQEGQVADAGPSASAAKTEVPDLASLFGKTSDEALAMLPTGSKVVSTKAGTDETNPDIVTIVDIAVAPSISSTSTGSSSASTTSSGSTGGTSTTSSGSTSTGSSSTNSSSTNSASTVTVSDLYISLNADNQIVKAYYAVSLDVLGNTDVAFDELLSDADLINSTLTSAGTGVSDFKPTVPSKDKYQMTSTGSDGTVKVDKETYTYTGSTKLGTAPTTWAITYTFDYSSVNITGNADDMTRMMYLSLS